MSKSLKKYTVSVLDEQYSLLTDEPEAHVQAAAQCVDMHMREISTKAQYADSKKIAILAAIQISSKALASQRILEKQNDYSDKLIDLINREII